MKAMLLKNSRYDELSDAEIEKYFGLLDFSYMPSKAQEKIKADLLKQAEEKPFLRRLIRDKIDHNKKISITATPEDLATLESEASYGMALFLEGRVMVKAPDSSSDDISGTVYHELLHIEQFSKDLWLNEEVGELTRIGNKLNEAEAISVTNLCEADPESYFHRLLENEQKALEESLKDEDIPYADNLTDEQKRQARADYIKGLASENAIGKNISLLMQQDGLDTMHTALDLNIELSEKDLENITGWRQSYNKQGADFSKGLLSEEDIGLSEDQQRQVTTVLNYFEDRYPVLKDLSFMEEGLSEYEKKQNGQVKDASSRAGLEFVLHPNGHMSYVANRDEEGLLDGAEVYYNADQQMIKKNEYLHGQLHGVQRQYAKDEKTGQLVVSNRSLYQNGELKKQINYNLQDGSKTIVEYENKDTYLSQTVSKEGEIVEFYQMKDGKPVGQSMFISEGFKYEYSYEEGEISSITQKSLETGETLKEEKRDSSLQPPLYQTTCYEKGKIQSYGYTTEKGEKIGRWVQTIDGKEIVSFYDGQGGEMKNPISDLKKEGYTPHPEDSNIYEYETKTGIYQVYLSSKTGLITDEGQISPDGSAIGNWIQYSSTGKETSHYHYSDEGGLISIDNFNEKQELANRVIVNTEDGTETRLTYWDKNKIRSAYKYQSATDKTPPQEVAYRSFHSDGTLYEEVVDETKVIKNTTGQVVSKSVEMSTLSQYLDYYESDPNKVKAHTVAGAKEVKTTYRKDGSCSSYMVTDKNGNGTLVCYGPQGRIRASGPVKNYQKDGTWTYHLPLQEERKIVFENGQRTNKTPEIDSPTFFEEIMTDFEEHGLGGLTQGDGSLLMPPLKEDEKTLDLETDSLSQPSSFVSQEGASLPSFDEITARMEEGAEREMALPSMDLTPQEEMKREENSSDLASASTTTKEKETQDLQETPAILNNLENLSGTEEKPQASSLPLAVENQEEGGLLSALSQNGASLTSSTDENETAALASFLNNKQNA